MTFVLVLVVFFSLKNHEYVHTIMICHVIMSMLLHVHQILTVIERTADCFGTWHFKKWTIPNSFKWWWTTLGCSCQNWTKNECRRNRAKKKKKGTPIALECPCIWFFWIDVEKKSIFKEFCASVYEEKAALLQRHWLIQLFSSQKWNTTYPIIQLCSFMSSSVLLLVPMNPSSLLGKIKNAQSILHGYLSDKKLHFVW